MNNVASTMCYPPYSPDIVRREIYDCLKRYKIHLMKNHWRTSYGITSICPNGSFYPNGIYKYPTGGRRNRFINLFSGSTSIVSSHCSYSPNSIFLPYSITIHLLKLNIPFPIQEIFHSFLPLSLFSSLRNNAVFKKCSTQNWNGIEFFFFFYTFRGQVEVNVSSSLFLLFL